MAMIRVAFQAAPLYCGSVVGVPFAIGVAAPAAVADTAATSAIAHSQTQRRAAACRIAQRDGDSDGADVDVFMCWDLRGTIGGSYSFNIARRAGASLNRTGQSLVQT